MAFRTLIVVGLLYLLHSCAQVGTLTGGEKDVIAPQPIEKKMEPQNGSTNFHGSEIKIPFDEFIKLENASETIVMIPPHAKPKAKVHGKTLYINWSEPLQENTTYSIYLNGTVKDVTEGNDSLMQIVFSTGNVLDSLSYEVNVVDAYSGVNITNCVVGLYNGTTDSIKPTYFAQTNKDGKATLSHLKQGTYTVLAFDDKNKDLLLQADERLAFKKETITLDSNFVDSIPYRLYKPKEKERIRSFQYKAPGLFRVGSTTSLKNSTITINDKNLEENDRYYVTEDSLYFLMEPSDSGKMELITSTNSFTDTNTIRILTKEKKGKLTFWKNLKNEFLSPKDTLIISFSDKITQIDTSLFKLINQEDSSMISMKKISFHANNLIVQFDQKNIKTVDFKILPKGITTTMSELTDTIKIPLELKTDEEFGSIKLDISDYSEAVILEVIMNGSVVQTVPIESKKMILLNYLTPNSYSFRVIVDQNKNGHWDTGDRTKMTYPEEIHSFSEVIKVRANWEMDVKLTKKP